MSVALLLDRFEAFSVRGTHDKICSFQSKFCNNWNFL